MDKKISVKSLYLLFVISLGLIGLAVGSTYALFTTGTEINNPIALGSDLTYNADVLETVQVKLEAGETKTITLNITNNSNDVLNYVSWYINDGYTVIYSANDGTPSGTLAVGSSSNIAVEISNKEDTSLTVLIGISSSNDNVVLGSNMVPIEKQNILMVDSVTNANSKFFGSDKQRSQIASVTFLDNITNSTGKTTYDVSAKGDGSVLMWYDANSTNSSLFDCYIGGRDGKVTITDGTKLFAYLSNATDISFNNSVNTSNMTSLYMAFTFDGNLRNIDFNGLDTSNVTNINTMFAGTGVEVLDLTSLDTSSVTEMATVFAQCPNLIEIKLSNWDTSNVTNMRGLFQQLSNDVQFDISNWDTSNVIDMYGMFQESANLTNVDLSGLDASNVTDMSRMFSECTSIRTINLNDFDTSNTTNMSYMFNHCESLIILYLNNIDTSNVTDMTSMFQDCSSLTSLNLSSFDTSKVTTMRTMFQNCSSLTSLDLSSFNTSNVTDMRFMFNHCESLTSLNLSSFDTSNVTTMRTMFQNCSSLTSLDLSSFNTSNVEEMAYMFDDSTSLSYINFSNADFSSVSEYTNTFAGVPNDSTIIVADSNQVNWITSRFPNLTNVKDKNSI